MNEPVKFSSMEIAILLAIARYEAQPERVSPLMRQDFAAFQEARRRLEDLGFILPDGPSLTAKGATLVQKGIIA